MNRTPVAIACWLLCRAIAAGQITTDPVPTAPTTI